MSSRLLLVGWDGATFDIARPLIAQGELPHLAQLMAQGVHGPLRSTTPPSSAVAWSTCMTGYNSEGHGIFGFHQTDGTSYRPRLVSSHDVRIPRLWDRLGQAGYQVGVVNVPVTYPPLPVNGFMVSGMLIPGPRETFTYPPGLGTRLLSGPRPYPIEAQVMKKIFASQSPADILRLLQRWTDDFHAAVRDLLSNHRHDCFIAIYRTTDIVQHALGFLWHPELSARRDELPAEVSSGIEAIYRQVDAGLGELLALIPPETTVMVVSDHGFGPSFGRFYINNWLLQNGYLALKPGIRYRRWLGHRHVPLRRILTRLGLGTLARRLPSRLSNWSIALPDTNKRHSYHLVDWRHTRAYVPFSRNVSIRLNLDGREPQGVVQPGAEAKALLAELARQMAALRDPQGEPLFREVIVTAQDTAGLMKNPDADLMVLPGDRNFHMVLPDITDDGQVFAGPFLRAVGQHRMDGIFVARGPAIVPGVTIQGARLADVTPTAMHLMGLAVPADMDGRVLTEALDPEWLSANPVQVAGRDQPTQLSEQGDIYSPEEAAQVEDVLRALGYLD